MTYRNKLIREHTGHRENVAYQQLSRDKQVIIYSVATDRGTIFSVSSSSVCPTCATGKMTEEHILQEQKRKQMGPKPVSAQEKFYRNVRQLQLITDQLKSTPVDLLQKEHTGFGCYRPCLLQLTFTNYKTCYKCYNGPKQKCY